MGGRTSLSLEGTCEIVRATPSYTCGPTRPLPRIPLSPSYPALTWLSLPQPA